MRQEIIVLSTILLLANAACPQLTMPPAKSQPASAPSAPVCVAVIEPEVLADLPADQRKAMAGTIDTLLTESLSRQKGLVLVDRQALNKVLAEKASKAGGIAKITAGEVDAELRPFWSAGVLVCSQVDAKAKVLIIEAVSTQTGQLVAGLCVSGKLSSAEDVAKAIAPKVQPFAESVVRGAARIQDKPLLEVSGKLVGGLTRMAWMVDDLADSIGARVDYGGKVVWLVPRQPLVTKEERLLRVMGLGEARNGDTVAGLSPVPQIRLTFELTDAAKIGVEFEETPISLKLSLRRGQDKPIEAQIEGKAGQWNACRAKVADWIDSELAWLAGWSTPEPSNQIERAKQLANEELEAARQLVADSGNRYDWFSYGTEHAVLARIARHALRSAHLDPTNEEAARYVALTCDSLYPLTGNAPVNAARYDRVIAECQRYLDRFRKPPKPYNPTFQVMQKCGDAGRVASYPLRQSGAARYADKPNDELYRYAKVDTDNSIPLYCAWVSVQGTDNIWAVCNRLRYEVFSNCPEDKLDAERDHWKEFWRTTVDRIRHSSPPPPFQFVEIGYYVRKKDYKSVRRLYSEMAARFPKLDNHAWSTRVPCTEQLWKEQLCMTLRAAGDPEWKTWEPTFEKPQGEVYYPKLLEWDELLFRLNPDMPPLWAGNSHFVGSVLTFPKAVLEAGAAPGDICRISALCVAGEDMIFAAPGVDPVLGQQTPHTLFAAPMSTLIQDQRNISVEPVKINWPKYPSQDKDNVLGAIQVRSSLVTTSDSRTVLWIGTRAHGIAMFNRQDGKWVGRWFTGKDGLPVQDIERLTACLYDGKPKILAIGSGSVKDANGHTNTVMWVMDESSGAPVILADSRQDANISNRMLLTWEGGQVVPLGLYNRANFDGLDLKKAKFSPPPKQWYSLVPGCSAEHPWGWWDYEHVGPVDPKTFAIRSGPPGSMGRGATPYYDDQTQFITMLPSHSMGIVKMPGQAPIHSIGLAAMSGEWLYLAMNGTVYSGTAPTLMAYRPAPEGKDWKENDLWVGPLAMPGGGNVRLVLVDGDRLWVATTMNTVCRIDCKAYIQKAISSGLAVSTSQWRKQFEERVIKGKWRNAVQYLLNQQKYDEALSLTADQMSKANRSDKAQLKEWTDAALWQAVTLARAPGRQDKAIELYTQLADDKAIEPTARAFAMINMIKVSHVAGHWQQVMDTADKLVRMFPELKPRESYSMTWYIADARKQLAAQTQPASGPANRPAGEAVSTPAP